MNIPIIYKDESLIVIDKPAGVVVNKSISTLHNTVQEWAEIRLGIKVDKVDIVEKVDMVEKEKLNIPSTSSTSTTFSTFFSRAGIVHRLDKDTSGILLIAKNPADFDHLQKQFRERSVAKTYTALVHGKMVPEKAIIKAAVGRLPWNRTKFGILPSGREAQTSYTVIGLYKKNLQYYSLLSVIPYTGRTHQIRIHLKYAGFPIVGDPLYAGRNLYRLDKLICGRLFLHAEKIIIKHPRTGLPMEFKSPLPPQLQSVLVRLTHFK